MKKLLIATTNPGKLSEIKNYLARLKIQLISFSDLNITNTYNENGKTFKQNAISKARFYSKITNLPTIADDGGLEIDYLNGLPGVKSRRWVNGDENISDVEIINHTLLKLNNVTLNKRTAQLKTVIALYFPNGTYYTATGFVKGVIAFKPHPILIPGFPYRSLLYLPKIKKYYHESDLSKEETDKYNHRGKVLKKLIPKLIKYI